MVGRARGEGGPTPRLKPDEIRRRVGDARVATLATVDPDGRPNLVPVTFALIDDNVVLTVVDHKPKSTERLKRVANIERDPRVTLLVHHYGDDWSVLWWCRGSGNATVGPSHDTPVSALQEKYPQYREVPPTGPRIRIEVTEWSGWAARAGER